MFIDLSHTIEDGMITYKGLPAPLICDFLSREQSRTLYAPGTEFQIGKIEMVANTGTYLDSPFHRFADGKDFRNCRWSGWPTWRRRGPARPVGRPGHRPASSGARPAGQGGPGPHRLGSATGGRTSYFEGHPFLTRDAAEYLRRCGAGVCRDRLV